ncbi:MAG: phosphate ABC transporter substrate-binding protein [Spirochaetota bacterium]
MKKTFFAALALAMAIPAAFAQLSGTFTWGGSTTVSPIAYAAIEQFQKDNPGVKITYESTGSGAGITSLLKDQYSLAGSSSELSQAQKDGGAFATAIGMDGLSVVVNKNVKLSNITKANLAKVYHGDITNWKDLGGVDAKIVVVNRDEASGTYVSFYDIFLKSSFAKITEAYTKDAIVTKESGEVAAKVTATPNSIGYIGMAFSDQVVAAGGRELMVDGVAPTVANVVTKKYGGSRFLYVVTKGEPKAGSVEKAFSDFLLSPKGQAIVKSTDYIPLPKK